MSTYIPHPRHVPFEYNKITPHVYLGTNQCCNVHFKKSLLKKGIRADISLEKEHVDAPFGVSYFLWLPVADFTAPTLTQLQIGAQFIQQLVTQNIKVYVHCKRGHGRSPTLVAAYLMAEKNTMKNALQRIRHRRRIHLTRGQLKVLKSFEQKMHKEKK